MPIKNTYTVKEVAGLLGFSTNTVYKYLDSGSIKSVRLGSEGRFRIPKSEVERLLQERGKLLPEASFDQTSRIDDDAGSINTPSLFNWFVAFLSISIGLSMFVFPSAIQIPNRFCRLMDVLQAALLISGFVIALSDFYKRSELFLKWLTLITGIEYILTSAILYFSQDFPMSVACLSVAVIILITFFINISEYNKFVYFSNIIFVLLGIGILGWPEKFYLAHLAGINAKNIVTFFAIWLLIVLFNVYLILFAIKKDSRNVWFVAIPTALISLSYSTFAFTQGFWTKTVFCVILASFAIIFPFAKEFKAYTLKSKKEMFGSIAWLFGVFAVGSLMLYYIYYSFQSYSFTELAKRTSTASDVITNYMDGNIAKVSVYASDNEFVNAMKNYSGDAVSVANSNLKQLYQSSNESLQKVILVDKNGIVLDTYPLYLPSIGVDISDRDYFKSAKVMEQTYVSGIVLPKSTGLEPVIVVSVPILDSEGTFLGVLLGDVDIAEMTRRINQIKFGDKGNYLLADADGKYIIPPEPDKIMENVSSGDYLLHAVFGESGTAQSVGSDGKLDLIAYNQVDKYGWGIVAQQPVKEALMPYSKTVFLTFLVYITSGAGSLVLVFSINRKIKQ